MPKREIWNSRAVPVQGLRLRSLAREARYANHVVHIR